MKSVCENKTLFVRQKTLVARMQQTPSTSIKCEIFICNSCLLCVSQLAITITMNRMMLIIWKSKKLELQAINCCVIDTSAVQNRKSRCWFFLYRISNYSGLQSKNTEILFLWQDQLMKSVFYNSLFIFASFSTHIFDQFCIFLLIVQMEFLYKKLDIIVLMHSVYALYHFCILFLFEPSPFCHF